MTTTANHANSITIACHCGAVNQTLPIGHDNPHPLENVRICHCTACRHVTGLLYVSYAPLPDAPPQEVLGGLVKYQVEVGEGGGCGGVRWLCGRCGGHVFRADLDLLGGDGGGRWRWSVATGVVTDALELSGPVDLGEGRHRHVEDTRDGGLAKWLLPTFTPPLQPDEDIPADDNEDHLTISCHCRSTTLLLTRPSLSSLPSSPYPDLLLPYHSTAPDVVSNPTDEKWYLREDPQHPGRGRYKYLAGTCACATCRLTSGFEIQTWTFVPRVNILVPPTDDGGQARPIEFPTATRPTQQIPNWTLKSHSSSPGTGITREFCRVCGATFFWHDRVRPDLLDLSAGLLSSPSGARAEEWLCWETGRVSFAEEAGRGREGGARAW
ncbi:hypothetical protein C8A05DRAFT_20404, partial [Staphylotrichum tortipilum]